MKTSLRLIKVIVGGTLLAGFLLAFFPDLTGLDGHQILGVGLGALALYHGLAHRAWIASIARRLAAPPGRGQALWVLDALLAAGFAVIVSTGLLISTWLNLSIDALALWTDVHVVGSMATLALVLVKVALHWKWFVQAMTLDRPQRVATASGPTVRAARPAGPTRRDFIGLMGVVGVAALAAGASVITGRYIPTTSAAIAEAASGTGSGTAVDAATTVAASPATTSTATSTTTTAAQTAAATATPDTAATETATATATSTATATAAPVAAAASTTCTVRCNKGCSYPGRCRKYTDANANGRCDLGECL